MQRVLGLGGQPRMPMGGKLTEEETAKLRAWIDAGALWPDAHSVKDVATATHWAYVCNQSGPSFPKSNTVPGSEILSTLCHGAIGKGRAGAFAGSGSRDPAPACQPGPDRPAAHPEEIDAFLPTRARTPTKSWSTGCWPRRTSASAGRGLGSIWRATPTRTATRKTTAAAIWKYRDWVIQALNSDMPFDEFTIEQIAGDMLPECHHRPAHRHRIPPQHDVQRGRRRGQG